MRTQRLVESDWDYCLVLDACRFDVFEAVYEDYLDGTLTKCRSPGSSTPEWAYRTFTDRHDIGYFSGNPFINDLGIPLNELKWGASCGYEWTANRHIDDVIDVWQHRWDDELGTVPPGNLHASFREHRDIDRRRARTVLHYMQPHAPYLSRGSGRKLDHIRAGIKEIKENEGDETDASGRLRRILEQLLTGSEFVQKMGLWLELDPADIARNGTRDTAMAYYEENVRIVLEAVADIVPELDGSVVVTADHGEAFGEYGVWEHHIETHIPVLTDVPWFEVR